MKVLLVQNGYYFRILHEILSDNTVFFWNLFRPLEMERPLELIFDLWSKLIVDDLADFTKTGLETLLLRVIHRE